MRLEMAQMSQFESFINKYNNIQTIKNSLFKFFLLFSKNTSSSVHYFPKYMHKTPGSNLNKNQFKYKNINL